MDIPNVLTYSVLAIAVFNFLMMITVVVVALLMYKKTTELLQEVKNVLQAARAVIANAEVATRRVSSGAESARRIVGRVEEAIAGLTPPLALISSSAKTARSSNLKMKLVGMAAGAALRFVMGRIRSSRS